MSITAEAYWRSLYERERARAEEAEGRCEELRWKEVDSRARAGTLKWQFDKCRKKLAARAGEVKEAARLRRAAEKREKKIESLRAEAGGLREKVKGLETRLYWEEMEARFQKKTVDRRVEEIIDLCGKLRESREELRVSLRAAGRVKERLKERLLRAKEAARSVSSRRDAELRKALGRSRCQKTALGSLSGENARLRRALRKSEARRARLEAELAKLRATGAALAKRLFGRKSERQEKPRSERRRGGQPGAQGHGRTPRPALDEREEVHNPPADARVCACCGQPYVANGAEVSTIIEIEGSSKITACATGEGRWR